MSGCGDPAQGLAPFAPGEMLPVADGETRRASCPVLGVSPGGSAAPPINILTSISDGLASGAIPSSWGCGVCWPNTGCNPGCVLPHSCDPHRDLFDIPTDSDGNLDKPVCELTTSTAYPFDIVHGVRALCSDRSPAALETQARAELDAITPARMAEYVSKLLAATATPLPGTACPPLETAVGLLFEARAAAGAGGGVLHLPDRAVGAAQHAGLLTRSGAGYRSVWNAPVVVGPGVANLPPTGQTSQPGTAWIYITSNVDYALSPIDRLDTQKSWDQARQNDIYTTLAERSALVRFDQCNVFAVCAALPCSCCGTGDVEEEGGK